MDDDQPAEPSLTAWQRSLQRVALWMVRFNRTREPRAQAFAAGTHSPRGMRCLPGDLSHRALEAASFGGLFVMVVAP